MTDPVIEDTKIPRPERRLSTNVIVQFFRLIAQFLSRIMVPSPPPSIHSIVGRAENTTDGGVFRDVSHETKKNVKTKDTKDTTEKVKEFFYDLNRTGTHCDVVVGSETLKLNAYLMMILEKKITDAKLKAKYPNLAQVQTWDEIDFGYPKEVLVLFHALCEGADLYGFGDFWRRLAPFLHQGAIQGDLNEYFFTVLDSKETLILPNLNKYSFKIDANKSTLIYTTNVELTRNGVLIEGLGFKFEVELRFPTSETYEVIARQNDERCQRFERWLNERFSNKSPTPAAENPQPPSRKDNSIHKLS